MAPLIPMAKYKLGAMAKPVLPHMLVVGRQCASATVRLQAVAAPNNFRQVSNQTPVFRAF